MAGLALDTAGGGGVYTRACVVVEVVTGDGDGISGAHEQGRLG